MRIALACWLLSVSVVAASDVLILTDQTIAFEPCFHWDDGLVEAQQLLSTQYVSGIARAYRQCANHKWLTQPFEPNPLKKQIAYAKGYSLAWRTTLPSSGVCADEDACEAVVDPMCKDAGHGGCKDDSAEVTGKSCSCPCKDNGAVAFVLCEGIIDDPDPITQDSEGGVRELEE